MRIGLLAAFALAGAPGLAAAAECTLGAATYRPVDGGDATIRFVPQEHSAYTDYAMQLAFPATGKSYAFSFTFSNGYSRQYALLELPEEAANGEPAEGEEMDPEAEEMEAPDLPSSPILFFDKTLARVEETSIAGPAPAYLILPDLGVNLWYGAPDGDRDNIPPEGLWRAACG